MTTIERRLARAERWRVRASEGAVRRIVIMGDDGILRDGLGRLVDATEGQDDGTLIICERVVSADKKNAPGVS